MPKNSETPGLHVSSAYSQRSTALPGQLGATVHVPGCWGPQHAGSAPLLCAAWLEATVAFIVALFQMPAQQTPA